MVTALFASIALHHSIKKVRFHYLILGYYKEEEKFLCKKCMANRKNRTCAACNNLIEDNEVFAMNNYYHSDCFKCSKCNLTLADHVSYPNLLEDIR